MKCEIIFSRNHTEINIQVKAVDMIVPLYMPIRKKYFSIVTIFVRDLMYNVNYSYIYQECNHKPYNMKNNFVL